MSVIELSTTAKTYRELQAEIRKMEAEAEQLKQVMIREMDNRQVEKLDAGEYKISYTIYETRRFDTTAFKSDHANLYESYVKQSAACRFQVA